MAEKQVTRYDLLPKPLKTFLIVIWTIGMGLGAYFIFGFHIGGFVFYDAAYYYLLFGIFGSGAFLILPEDRKVRWYDFIFSAYMLVTPVWFFFNAEKIVIVGWVPASTFNVALAGIFLLLILI